ncbi:MAG: ferritin-like domain-containing protein [Candidatus Nanopelagicaceae bacterium]
MATAEKSPYLSMIAKKRPWQAVPVDQGKLVDGSEQTLYRALALRHLELPVRDYLEQGLERDLPATPGVVEALRHNQADEERHDEALGYIAAAHGVDAEAEKEVMNILKAWNEHPAHPILKASVLERSLFFVILPFFRFNGDVGIRTVSADISRDEITHVGVHSLVAKELGEGAGQSLNKLRRATALWIFDKLGQSENKWLDKDFWLRQSDNLFERGKAEELSETSRSRMPAFFEAANTSLPSYGR